MRMLVWLLLWAAPDTRPAIVAFGDSITDGFGVPKGSAYPEQLQRMLDAKGKRWRVVNAGVSGDTTSNALDRMPGVLELKPKLVIVEIGGNDGLRGLPLEMTRKNLDEMIGKLRGAGARVLLVGMTLPANYGREYVTRFERMYEEVASKHRVTLAPASKAGMGGLMQPDGLHPTPPGHRRLAEFLLPYVEKEL